MADAGQVLRDDPRFWTPAALGAVVAFPGPFTRGQAVSEGITDVELSAMVSTGRLTKLLTGVYADATIPVDLALRARAIGLVAPPEAVVVDRTAAWLHGLDLLRRSSVHEAPPVQVYLRKDTRIRRGGVDSGRRKLQERDLMQVAGVVVTTPLRTCLDLLRSMWKYDALGALDRFVAAELVVPEELVLELERFRGWRGVVQARALLPLVDPRSESMPESALRLHWHESLPVWPQPQHWVFDDGIGIYRLDLADPKRRYCGEHDGEEFHTSPEDREHDELRRRWCRDEHGWLFDVFTKQSVYGLRPHPSDVLVAGWHRANDRSRR